MSARIVRTVTKVKDVNKLADHVTNDNDIITDINGNVFLKHGTKNYIKLALSEDSEDSENLRSEITSLKSENTKLKNRVSDLETSNEDLITRVETLENADTTT